MIRVGLIDGALPGDWPGLVGQEWFCRPDAAELASGHAEAMAQTVCTHAEDVLLLNAVVFPGQLSTTLDAICAALSWLAEAPPDIVLCAFGMARSSIEMSVAVARLQQAGSLIVGSAPARGGNAYPAAITGVLSVQGMPAAGRMTYRGWTCRTQRMVLARSLLGARIFAAPARRQRISLDCWRDRFRGLKGMPWSGWRPLSVTGGGNGAGMGRLRAAERPGYLPAGSLI